MIVYLLTNAANGKQYVGATTRSLRARWREHISDSRRYSSSLYQAFKEYGTSAFEKRTLSVALNAEALDQLERFWIGEFNTLEPNGYNAQSGGREGFRAARRKHSLETRAGMSARMMGNTNTLGHKASPETRAKLTASAIGRKDPPKTRANKSAGAIRGWAKRRKNAR
jgi:group I intron endonuclease